MLLIPNKPVSHAHVVGWTAYTKRAPCKLPLLAALCNQGSLMKDVYILLSILLMTQSVYADPDCSDYEKGKKTSDWRHESICESWEIHNRAEETKKQLVSLLRSYSVFNNYQYKESMQSLINSLDKYESIAHKFRSIECELNNYETIKDMNSGYIQGGCSDELEIKYIDTLNKLIKTCTEYPPKKDYEPCLALY